MGWIKKLNLFKNFKRKAPAEIAIHICVSVIFMLVALSYLYILVWSFIAGLRTNSDIVMDPFGFSNANHWGNYIDVFSQLEVNGKNFLDMLLNSIWFSIGSALLVNFITMSFAYCCCKYKFPGHNLPYVIILVMITLPIYGGGGATYKLLHNLGLINSYAYILTNASGFNASFLYYTAYFKNLSWTYAEAAMIDGANEFQIYRCAMMPQAKPIFGALFLTNWIAQWNSYEGALLYLPSLPTLPVGIYQFNIEMVYRARLDILFAGCVLVAVPAIVIYVIFNKTITTNVSVGGIKG